MIISFCFNCLKYIIIYSDSANVCHHHLSKQKVNNQSLRLRDTRLTETVSTAADALEEKPGIYSCVPGCCTVSDCTVYSLMVYWWWTSPTLWCANVLPSHIMDSSGVSSVYVQRGRRSKLVTVCHHSSNILFHVLYGTVGQRSPTLSRSKVQVCRFQLVTGTSSAAVHWGSVKGSLRIIHF